MLYRSARLVYSCAVLVAVGSGGAAVAQDAPKVRDDALDALINELTKPKKAAAKSATAGKEEVRKPEGSKDKAESGPRSKSADKTDKTAKPATSKSPDAGKVAPKDQALDELLGKLGERKDEPAP